jgi:hypothetical protein
MTAGIPGCAERETAELADGAAVALFEIAGVNMSRVAFVEINGALKAGHAAHPRCSTGRSLREGIEGRRLR